MNPNENHPEPLPDVPSPVPNNEEIVDPTIPAGNHEVVIIKRHPFGLVALYLQVIVGLAAAGGLIDFLVNQLVSTDNRSSILPWLNLVLILIAGVAVIFLIIATFVYLQNRWVVTDDSITQITQTGLFKRQMSELSMANIEDVTAVQNGLLATVFGFGTLKAETAGERSNFHFIYCPRPNMYAKIVLDARERFINENPDTAKRANNLLAVPRT